MPDGIEEVLSKFWGFDRFLPLQRRAMECVCRGCDSIVVLPTGGGKSLCFQAPALVLPRLTLALSPLISLMKDQIDSLLDSGIPAGRLDSAMSHPERKETYDRHRIEKARYLRETNTRSHTKALRRETVARTKRCARSPLIFLEDSFDKSFQSRQPVSV